METTCLTCHKPFEAWPCKKRKYCGRECSLGKQGHKKRAFGWLLNKIRYEARKAGRPCSLTYTQLIAFTSVTACHYCNAGIEWHPHATKNSRCYYLDRKNNAKGYSKRNCVVCCSRCNRAKSYHFTYAEWKAIGLVIRKFRR